MPAPAIATASLGARQPTPCQDLRARPAGGVAPAGGFGAACLAAQQMALELFPVGFAERVQCVGAGQRVRVGPAEPHESVPRQSRSRISPSRIRVLTVPTATPSSAATSR